MAITREEVSCAPVLAKGTSLEGIIPAGGDGVIRVIFSLWHRPRRERETGNVFVAEMDLEQ